MLRTGSFAYNLPLWRERRKTLYPCDSRQLSEPIDLVTMTDIDVLLTETRKFEPPPEFRLTANVPTPDVYDKAELDPEKFWAEQARELEWIKP